MVHKHTPRLPLCAQPENLRPPLRARLFPPHICPSVFADSNRIWTRVSIRVQVPADARSWITPVTRKSANVPAQRPFMKTFKKIRSSTHFYEGHNNFGRSVLGWIEAGHLKELTEICTMINHLSIIICNYNVSKMSKASRKFMFLVLSDVSEKNALGERWKRDTLFDWRRQLFSRRG